MSVRRKDQERALEIIRNEMGTSGGMDVLTAPLFDMEIRGVPALQFFGMSVWR